MALKTKKLIAAASSLVQAEAFTVFFHSVRFISLGTEHAAARQRGRGAQADK
jgi:hypothetical protein